MAAHPRWRRRQTLVNPEHQLRFTTVLLVQMTAVMLVIAGYAWAESRQTLDLVLRHLGDFPATSHELHLNNQAFLLKIILAIAFTGMFQILFGIYASHKLAGPAHKMTGVLERAARGDFGPRVSFREADDLEEVAAALNRALATLARDQKSARDEVLELERALDRIASVGHASDSEIEQLRQRLAEAAGVEYRALEPVGC